MKQIAAIALLLLAGCAQLAGTYDTAKGFVYSRGASLGNDYCAVKDPVLAAQIETRLNAGLREAGAKFTVSGAITCD